MSKSSNSLVPRPMFLASCGPGFVSHVRDAWVEGWIFAWVRMAAILRQEGRW